MRYRSISTRPHCAARAWDGDFGIGRIGGVLGPWLPGQLLSSGWSPADSSTLRPCP